MRDVHFRFGWFFAALLPWSGVSAADPIAPASSNATTPAQVLTPGFSLAEELVLAPDPAEVVAGLTPGTLNHEYWQAILLQHQGELEAVDRRLAIWRQRLADGGERPGEIAALRRIEARQALLWWGRNPGEAVRRLSELQYLRVDHPAPQAVADAAALRPNRLNPELLSWPAHRQSAMASSAPSLSTATAERLIAEATYRELRPQSGTPFAQRKILIAALRAAGDASVPGTVDAIIAELLPPPIAADKEQTDYRSAFTWGSLLIHQQHGEAALTRIARSVPGWNAQPAVVQARLAAITAEFPDALARDDDRAVRWQWLERLQKLVAELPSNYAPLQAQIQHHRLALLVTEQRVTTADVVVLLRLNASGGVTNQGAAAVRCPELNDDNRDEIRSAALEQVLATSTDVTWLQPYLDAVTARSLWVRAKLAAGVDDPAEWIQRLPNPAVVDEWRSEQRLRFVPLQRRLLSATAPAWLDPAWLEIETRNVTALTVRIWRLDTLGYARAEQRLPTADIDLTGVLPNHEREIVIAAAPLRQHRQRIDLPECTGPGLTVVELLAGGQALRALLRRGELRVVARTVDFGRELTLFSESGAQLLSGVAYLGDREFTAAADGTISMRFASQAVIRPLVVSAAGRVAVTNDSAQSEELALSAEVLTHREQLIPGGFGHVVIRPKVMINDHVRTRHGLSDMRVIVTADSGTYAVQAADYRPAAPARGGDLIIPFRLPDDARSIRIDVQAKVESTAQVKPKDVTWMATLETTAEPTNHLIDNVWLSRDRSGYHLTNRDRAGQPRPGVMVKVMMRTRYGMTTVAMVTDADGRIELGELAEVENLWAEFAPVGIAGSVAIERLSRSWTLRTSPPAAPPRQVVAGQAQSWPWPTAQFGSPRLVRLSGSRIIEDRSTELRRDGSVLNVPGLSAGTWEVRGEQYVQVVEVVAQQPSAGQVRAPSRLNCGWIADSQRIESI